MSSSSNKEDYLKAIYENDGIDSFVSNKTLSQHLSVAPASVSEMVEKLNNDGLIEYKPYTGVKLTLTGLNQTIQIIRNHRIFETFLYHKLDYSLCDLHHLSEELEHVKDGMFFEKLYEFLGKPSHCPHGGIIPTKHKFKEEATLPLSEFPKSKPMIIHRVMDDASILSYLETIDLSIGDIITILDRDIFNELIIFEIQKNNTVHHISYKQAHLLFSISPN